MIKEVVFTEYVTEDGTKFPEKIQAELYEENQKFKSAEKKLKKLIDFTDPTQPLSHEIIKKRVEVIKILSSLKEMEIPGPDLNVCWNLPRPHGRNNSGWYDLIPAAFDSSWIEDFLYQKNSEILIVWFKNGSVYRYYDVPLRIFRGFDTAEAKGQYFHAEIRDVFKFKKVS